MRAALGLMLLMAMAAPAAAQDGPRFDVSGGYSWLRETQADQSFHGWLASGVVYVNPWLGILGEVGKNYKSLDPEPGLEIRFDELSYMGGVRLCGYESAIAAYIQVAAGGVRFHTSISDPTVDEDLSVTKFALQPGGGLDIYFGPHVGVRFGGDYRRVFVNEMGVDGFNEWRLHAGIVIRGGR